MLPASFPNAWSEETTFPATEQVSLYFSMSCLLQVGHEVTEAASAGARGLLGMPGLKGAVILPLLSPSPSAGRRLPSPPQSKCGESHFCLIRPAAWRKMIASRCTRVLRRKEFGGLCWLCNEQPAPGSISALFNFLQVLGASIRPCSGAETRGAGGAWRNGAPRVSGRDGGRRHGLQAHLTAGIKAPSCKDPYS